MPNDIAHFAKVFPREWGMLNAEHHNSAHTIWPPVLRSLIDKEFPRLVSE